jgi:transcriptional regulator with XRE-family HTH domain
MRRGRKVLMELGSEWLEARVAAGLAQEKLGIAIGMSGTKIGRIEHGRLPSLSILDAHELSAMLGLDLSIRLYPAGSPLRDEAQARRLRGILEHVRPPLRYRVDVPLAQHPDQPRDMRAWDAVLYGHGERTAIELESRLRDLQATVRRHALKRRDDPVDHFLMAVADTRTNRRVIYEFGALLPDLPRLRTGTVLKLLSAGQHPPTGFILV